MKTAKLESPTKLKMMDSAQQLMLAKGFVATKVDEICAGASVTKGSFFHYFKSKEDLAKQLLERFSAQYHAALAERVAKNGEDPLDRVLGYLDFFIEYSEAPGPKSCLMGNFAQELSETHPELRASCGEKMQQVVELFREDLAKARASYPPVREFDVSVLAEYFITIVQGSIVLAKAKQDCAVLGRTVRFFRSELLELFGQK